MQDKPKNDPLAVELDKQFYETLEATQPGLFKACCESLDLGATPRKIEKFVLRYTPKHSVIPGLVRGAMEHYKRMKSN
jgi:hypothetical protein